MRLMEDDYLKFNAINQTNLKDLQSMVASDRISTGESVMDLHAKDQSHHAPVRPEVVIWPAAASEVAAILKYANQNLIPVKRPFPRFLLKTPLALWLLPGALSEMPKRYREVVLPCPRLRGRGSRSDFQQK